MKRNSGSVLVTTLILIIIGLLLFSGYTTWKIWFESKPPEIKTANLIQEKSLQEQKSDYSNWKLVNGSDQDGNKVYEIKIPPDWKEIEHSSNFYYLQSFQAPDKSIFEIRYQYAQGKSLAIFLSDSDRIAQTPFEGKPSKQILSSKNTVFANYKGIEREENLLAAGLKVMTTYSLIDSSQIFSFTLKPNSNFEPKETDVYKNYTQILNTFKYVQKIYIESRETPCIILDEAQCSKRPDCRPDYLPNMGNNFLCSKK